MSQCDILEQAGSPEHNRQLLTQPAEAPKDTTQVYMQAFAPICCIKDSFERATAAEADRSEARLGFRTPTAFLKAMPCQWQTT